jgi:hypothetical protein
MNERGWRVTEVPDTTYIYYLTPDEWDRNVAQMERRGDRYYAGGIECRRAYAASRPE